MIKEKKKKQQQNSLVVRRNDLVEGRYRINSCLARRILYRALAQINPSETDFKKSYNVKLSDVADVSGLKMNDSYYPRAVEAIKLLQSQVAEIFNPVAKKYTVYSWFNSIDYDWGEGSVSLMFHENMKPVLLNLIRSGNFTVADEKFLAIINSPYSDRIYGLLKQYQKAGCRTMTIEEIRKKLKIEKKYPLFYDFRRYVLDVTKKEINQKTDISFDYELIRKGRKVVAIHFIITSKKPSVTLENKEETDSKAHTIFQALKRHGVAEKTARELIADYDMARIEWHVKQYEKLKNAKKANGEGWLIQGIKEDYRPQKSIFEEEEEEKRQKSIQERERLDALNSEIDRIKGECDKYNRSVRMGIVNGLSEVERSEIDQEFKERSKNFPGIAEKLDTEGLKNRVVKGLYLDLIRQKYPDSGMSYRDYAEKHGAGEEILQMLR